MKLKHKLYLAVGATAVASIGVGAAILRKPKPTGRVLPPSAGTAPPDIYNMIMAERAAQQLAQQSGGLGRLIEIAAAVVGGTAVVMNEQTFRTIHQHLDGHAFETVLDIFYPGGGGFTMNELTNHAHCQSNAAAVTQLYYDYYGWFNLHCVAMDPLQDPAGFQAAVNACIENNIQAVMKKTAMGSSGMYLLVVPKTLRDWLVRFARDMAAKAGKSLPTADGNGQPLTGSKLGMVHGAVGAVMVAKLIETLESSDASVNPCIKELDFGTVVSMFMATFGVVLSLATGGGGMALGPALDGLNIILKIEETIRTLSKFQ